MREGIGTPPRLTVADFQPLSQLQIGSAAAAFPAVAFGRSVSLGGRDHIVVVTQSHTKLLPFTEVLSGRNSPHSSLTSDRPVLREGTCAKDRGLVDTLAREDLVGAFLESEVSFASPRLTRGQVPMSIDDVVLDQRVPRPSVNRQVSGTSRFISTTVFNRSYRHVSERHAWVSRNRSYLDPPELHPFPQTNPLGQTRSQCMSFRHHYYIEHCFRPRTKRRNNSPAAVEVGTQFLSLERRPG